VASFPLYDVSTLTSRLHVEVPYARAVSQYKSLSSGATRNNAELPTGAIQCVRLLYPEDLHGRVGRMSSPPACAAAGA
jgi:hypothetical protein